MSFADGADIDVVDEAIELFRANVLFRKFDIHGEYCPRLEFSRKRHTEAVVRHSLDDFGLQAFGLPLNSRFITLTSWRCVLSQVTATDS